MTALSIILPDALAQESSLIAKELHISRSHFIRLAIKHEIKAYKLLQEQKQMLAGFKSLKQNAEYLKESKYLERLNDDINDEDGSSTDN